MSLYLLTPSETVNQVFEYCLALAAEKYGILVHAVWVEANHFHLELTGPLGNLSDFVQELDSCVARCLLEYYRKRFPNRRLDALWSPAESFNATLLATPNAVIHSAIYTLVNPVKDGLVHDYRKWPGFNTRPSGWRGRVRRVKRPDYYFKHTPKELEYQVVPPTQLLQDRDLEGVIAEVETQIRERQKQAATDIASQGRTFMGVKAIMKIDPFSSPSTPRPHDNLNPEIAAGGDREALSLATKALQAFRYAYREAWKLYQQGAKAVFPGGTLLMRRRFGVPCDPLDATCWC
jgi:putative transposase